MLLLLATEGLTLLPAACRTYPVGKSSSESNQVLGGFFVDNEALFAVYGIVVEECVGGSGGKGETDW